MESGERRTRLVLGLTAVTMVVEIAAGLRYGSMALLADGLHMGSHATALGINAFAYSYARRHADDPRFAFGTGKVNALGGYTGAVLLGVFSLMMAGESLERFLHPVAIGFDQAIAVAVLGLVVNGASVWILGDHHGHDHDHDHGDHHHHEDHNLRSAYLHVLADALTSLLAIVALLAGKYHGMGWLDPVMGIVGAILVARWSLGLLGTSGEVLLDHQLPEEALARIRSALETEGVTLVELRVWSIGPGKRAAELRLEAAEPEPPEVYRARLPEDLHIVRALVEVNRAGDQ